MNNKKMITLMIIGVIAVLTIPNLVQKHTEKNTVKKVQKFYSTLSDAFSLAMKKNGPVSNWRLTDSGEASTEKIYEVLFKPYFKIAKNCGGDNDGNCIANVKYKFLNNSDSVNFGTSRKYYIIALDDGSSVCFGGEDSNIYIFYDINGAKGPNQWGRDLFDFGITYDSIIPTGIKDIDFKSFQTYCKTTSKGYACSTWIIYKGNMDYLHCDGLTWNSRSCKDK